MRAFPRFLLLALVVWSFAAFAGDPPPKANPLTNNSRNVYGILHKILVHAAELTPEEAYAFKPVDSVRTFGQIVGHVADAQYGFCSAARGEKNPAPKIEKTKSAKGDLVAALHEAFAYCDQAYDGMTDGSGSDMVILMGTEMPKLGVLAVSQAHTMEHYGNLVTYMRMNGLVPPTSDREFMATLYMK